MSFRRALVTGDNNQDLDLNQCVHLLSTWGGTVSTYNAPASFGYHGSNRGVFSTQFCLQDCVGKYNYHFVLLSGQDNSGLIQNQLSISLQK